MTWADLSGWAVMFGAGTAWFGWRTWRDRQDRAATTGSGRHPHHVPHLVMCGAMVYMLLATGAATSAASTGLTMGGAASAGRFPLLALVLAVFMVGYVMWQADRLPALSRTQHAGAEIVPHVADTLALATGTAPGARPVAEPAAASADPAAGPARYVLSPRLAACCQIAVAVTMGYMLILML